MEIKFTKTTVTRLGLIFYPMLEGNIFIAEPNLVVLLIA